MVVSQVCDIFGAFIFAPSDHPFTLQCPVRFSHDGAAGIGLAVFVKIHHHPVTRAPQLMRQRGV